jgi:hypothetical protein
MTDRVLFVCAQGSIRARLAASLLQAQGVQQWEAWNTPSADGQGTILVEQILRERGVPLLSTSQVITPAFGMRWEEGIVLCSGGTDT